MLYFKSWEWGVGWVIGGRVMQWRVSWKIVQERGIEALNLGCLREWQGRVVAAVVAGAAVMVESYD